MTNPFPFLLRGTTTRAAVLMAGVLLFAGRPAAAADATVVARLGAETVTLDEVRSLLAGLDAREQAALAKNPTLLAQTVRTALTQRMLLEEAQARHWAEQPEVAAKLERVRQATLLETYLQSVAQPPADFPGDDELRAAYEANKAAYQVPRQFHLAQIFIALPKGADAAAREKARARVDALVQKLGARGADFSALARAESEETDSASRGGEIGWLAEAQIQPELRARVIGLATGAVSEPRELADGWHILKMLEVREARVATLDEIRAPLKQQLRAERARVNAQEYLARLAKQTPLTLNELALTEVFPPAAK